MPGFWQPVVPTFRSHFGLKAGDSVLDVGCAKGFMMHDMAELIPGLVVKGIDVSDYAIAHAMADMKPPCAGRRRNQNCRFPTSRSTW